MSIENKRSSLCTPAECYVYSIGDMKIMKADVTPEVAAAHRKLEEVCKRFETSVDKFRDSPLQSLRTQDFYESECVPTAVECVDALSKFESARSYEITAYEWTVAEADDKLQQQKRDLEKNVEQRTKVYESEIAEADSTLRQQKRKLEENASQSIKTYEGAIAEEKDTLRQQKRKLEENASQSIKTYEGAIAEDDDTLLQQKRELEEDTTSKIRGVESEVEQFSDVAKYVGLSLSLTETARKSESKISYHKALNAAKNFCTPPISWKYFKKKRITETLQTLQSAAIEECNSIQKANQNEVKKVLAAYDEKVAALQAWKEKEDIQAAKSAAKALAAHDKKVEDIQAWKEKEDIQAAKSAAKALAAHDKKVEDIQAWKEKEEKQARRSAADALAAYNKETEEARLKKNQAIVDIQQEHQAFDTRLCQCIDRFQLVVDTWVTENPNATSVLNKDRLQDLNRNSEEIGSCLTLVGTVGIWDLSDKTSKPVTTVQPMKHTADTQAVKHYLNTIANAEVTTQPIEYTEDTQAVKHYLDIIANDQGNNKVQKNLNTIAEQGNTEAQFTLGSMYEKGISVQKNEGEAVNWYRKAAESDHKQALKNLNTMAEQGNTEAQFTLGSMYEKGISVQKNEGEAVNWYRKAADQGHADAQYKIGRGVRKDEEEAAKWYRKAAEQGHALAKGILTDFERRKAAKEQRKAVKEQRKAAESGNVDVQYQLAVMYQNGQGVHKSDYEAKEWYQKAAKQGHADAQYQLAGLTDFLSDSMEWYAKAAEQGHTKAQDYLSKIEDAEAQYQLGSFYYHWKDCDDLHIIYPTEDSMTTVKKNEYQAVEWYRKAAEQGHAWAQYTLGTMYKHGSGVERSHDEAAEWHRKVEIEAEHGDVEAQYTLGSMFDTFGFITPYEDEKTDKRLATKWYRKAAEQGHDQAGEALRKLEKRR